MQDRCKLHLSALQVNTERNVFLLLICKVFSFLIVTDSCSLNFDKTKRSPTCHLFIRPSTRATLSVVPLSIDLISTSQFNTWEHCSITVPTQTFWTGPAFIPHTSFWLPPCFSNPCCLMNILDSQWTSASLQLTHPQDFFFCQNGPSLGKITSITWAACVLSPVFQ